MKQELSNILVGVDSCNNPTLYVRHDSDSYGVFAGVSIVKSYLDEYVNLESMGFCKVQIEEMLSRDPDNINFRVYQNVVNKKFEEKRVKWQG